MGLLPVVVRQDRIFYFDLRPITAEVKSKPAKIIHKEKLTDVTDVTDSTRSVVSRVTTSRFTEEQVPPRCVHTP